MMKNPATHGYLRAHYMFPYGPTDGHRMNKPWASAEQALGTHCQHSGQRVPKLKARFWALYFHFPTSFQKKTS